MVVVVELVVVAAAAAAAPAQRKLSGFLTFESPKQSKETHHTFQQFDVD